MSHAIVMSPFDESFKKKTRFDFQHTAQMPEPRETAFKSTNSLAEQKTARVTLARVKQRLNVIAKVAVKRQ